jgi:CheY-like chemotaxis protein
MSDGPIRIMVVDDNLAMATTAKVLLENAGFDVTICDSPIRALEEIPNQRPDCVLLDIMMPEMDGLDVCRRLRERKELANLKIVMFTAKSFKYDRSRAAELGANGYIVKPIDPETFADQVKRLIIDEIEVKFWGVRGTLPRPGHDSLRYGGNTSCVTLSFENEPLFVLDAGSGIKNLSNALMAKPEKRTQGKILISHPHWDHINALPFFAPFYVPGNDFEIIGADQSGVSVRDFVSAQMDGVYFPITTREFGARVEYRDLGEGTHKIAGLDVETLLLSHPGNCLGYRINHEGRSICYITDNELFLPDSPYFSQEYEDRLSKFVEGTDALITDTTYTDEDYPRFVGFGHSCVSQVAALAARAQVKTLYLFHHDPDQSDDDIDRKLASTREALMKNGGDSVNCVAPAEGDAIFV